MALIKKIKDKKVNFEFNKEYIKVVTDKISNNDAQFITNSFKEMHPADAADIIEHLSQNDRENLIKLNNFKIDPEVFIELNESVQIEIIKYLSSDAIVRILKNLESDDAIAILENVEEKDKNSILSLLPPKDRFALLEGLSYPEESAARIMQREFTAIPSNWSVGQTIDYLRENKDLPEQFLEIYIVDENFKPIGTVPSSKVLRTPREAEMSSIMEDSTILVPVDMDREEVGHLFENYNLNSACVVDKNNKLVGMITSDDVLTVLKEEAEEDALRLAGVGDEEITDGVITKTNFTQNIFKEFNIGILNGIIFAIISSFIVQLWFQDIILSLIISISMILTMIVAGLFGIVVPVTLKKMNIDPAIASSVFVTTITDVIGFVSFLGVGAYFL